MAYSRWGNSSWYTYWEVHPIDSIENRDNAIFTICDVISFTALELRTNMESCLEKAIEKRYDRVIGLEENPDALERAELRIHMARFLWDIENSYPSDEEAEREKEDKL